MHFTISQHPRHAMVGKEVEQSSKSKILEFPISAASLRSISEIHPTERILPNTVRSKLRGMYPSYDSNGDDNRERRIRKAAKSDPNGDSRHVPMSVKWDLF